MAKRYPEIGAGTEILEKEKERSVPSSPGCNRCITWGVVQSGVEAKSYKARSYKAKLYKAKSFKLYTNFLCVEIVAIMSLLSLLLHCQNHCSPCSAAQAPCRSIRDPCD